VGRGWGEGEVVGEDKVVDEREGEGEEEKEEEEGLALALHLSIPSYISHPAILSIPPQQLNN
jgi:hypothetical protein